MEIYFSLGSNIGDRNHYLDNSIKDLCEFLAVDSPTISSIIETDPCGFESQDKFLNAVVGFDMDITENPREFAFELLSACKEIERKYGRDSKVAYDGNGNRIYTSRTIDIDILFIGNLRMDTPSLTIPHKLMCERDFVMIPLQEIASDSLRMSFPEIFQTK